MDQTLITNVHIVDGASPAAFPGEVLVAGNRIQAVAEGSQRLPREGASVLNGQGAYLMPGLVESHVHIGLNDTDDIVGLGFLPPEEHTLLAMRNARLYLDHGFTGLISAGSVKPRLDIVIRNAINSGQIAGPRLVASTPWLTVTGGLVDMNLYHMRREAIALVVDGPDNYRRIVRELIREGVDIVKLIISGDTGIPYAPSRATVMTEEEVAAAAGEARCRFRRVSAHARSAESIKRAIRHGVSIIYHATFADEEALDLLEAHRDRLFVSPNIGFTAAGYQRTAAAGQEAERQTFEEELEAACRSISALRRRGVRILGGGDYGFASTPHGQNARDLEHFVNLFGFSPLEAIQTMTRYGGEALELATPVGLVSRGHLADLLLVNGNPLEDVTLLQRPENFLAIMKDGGLHKAPAAGENRFVSAG